MKFVLHKKVGWYILNGCYSSALKIFPKIKLCRFVAIGCWTMSGEAGSLYREKMAIVPSQSHESG